ncbi:phosphotransferase family protein [Caulobacter mirabilis]|uniref:Aminoglycoside phosphotransferase n=1 Tax=Caulobacter mirabilis TaxID=69666 RepID=A0A2D2B1L9_9CAUL|nr:aminoglycoside phosphotransferase family protein [Caulobacter mirabilis]ATQ44141.1 aminoglycoside phosphotransferase [Caulobacter mirabilis]
MTTQDQDILDALARLGLDPRPPVQRLSGGVSCDVLRVELADGPVCVKRALPQLKVAADWKAPVERSHSEVLWLKAVQDIPGVIAPHVLAESEADHLFVMSWFDAADHPVWKSQLAAGFVDIGLARQLGAALAAIHSTTARKPEMAADFATGDLFHALRLEPYLLHTAKAHPDLATRLTALAERTLATGKALVHGDVSPKNILAGPDGPVFLDAECAWWGEPAFDLAFCLNHLLLKGVWKPAHIPAYLAAFEALKSAYMAGVDWEPAADLDRRVAALLSALLLARVDGKSPAEYLTSDRDKDFVRTAAHSFVQQDNLDLASLAGQWTDRVQSL